MLENTEHIFDLVNKDANNMEKITDWFVEYVKENYADDVAIIVAHKNL